MSCAQQQRILSRPDINSLFLHFRAFSGVGSGEATGEDGDTGHVALDYEATSRGPNTMFVMCHV